MRRTLRRIGLAFGLQHWRIPNPWQNDRVRIVAAFFAPLALVLMIAALAVVFVVCLAFEIVRHPLTMKATQHATKALGKR